MRRFDYDAIVVGGGPAGLTAGIHLSRAGHRALLLESGLFGGALKNVEALEGCPGFPDGTSGAQAASELAEQAARSGLRLKQAAVTGVEAFSSTRWVECDDGSGYSAGVVVVATGARFRKLGIPGEEELLGRGVIDCTPCDAGFFADRAVAVCGSDDHALADALSLARLAAAVTLLTRSAGLQGGGAVRERVLAHPRIEIRCGVSLDGIVGTDRVEAVRLTDLATGREEALAVDGVVIRVGTEPNTDFLEQVVDLDHRRRIVTLAGPETSAPGVLAAGDVRSGSPPLVAAAVQDGTTAARRAAELLALST